MVRTLGGLLLLACIALAVPVKEEDSTKEVDIIQEFKDIGEDSQRVGKVLCDIAKAWKDAAQKEASSLDDQNEEYFFKKLFRGARKVFRQVGKAGLEIGKRFIGQKAQEMIRQKIRERTGQYSFEDSTSFSEFLQHLAEDVDMLGETLIAKGVALNDGVVLEDISRDAETEKFVQDCITAF